MAENDRSTMVGLVVVGAILLLGGGAFVANFAGQVAKPDKADQADKGGKAKGKAKAKAKAAALPSDKKPEDQLLTKGLPFERPAAPEGAPNVVFVVLTAARKDQLSPYGGDPKVTPFLAKLAGQGTRFLDTIGDGPFSRPAATAMLTGRHAWNVDMVEPGPKASTKVLPATVPTVAEVLQRAGWTTYGLTANFNLNVDTGLARGFDLYWNAQPNGFAPGRRLEGEKMTTMAIEWVRAAPADRPFYLQLDYIDAHSPIRVVESELAAFDKSKKNAPYRAALNRIDTELERLYDALAEGGHGEDTLWVVVADHGEGLEDPEHHGALHGRMLYESSVAVPWIVAGPGIAANGLVQGLAAHVDVAPTVLELAGASIPPGIDGMSHAAAARGAEPRTRREQTHSATWHFEAKRVSVWTSERQCQLDMGSTFEAGSDSFVDACYDRRVDPTFTQVIADAAAVDALRAWYADVSTRITTTEGAAGEGAEPAEGDAAP